MINFRHIRDVAKYERLTLSRSWFFRIFSILVLLYLFFVNLAMTQDEAWNWTLRAVPANLPYVNVLFVNIAQAVIVVFLASDFLKRDKKLDTTEVIYARPISNGEYVIGKTSGIVSLFIILLLVGLLLGVLFNLVVSDTRVVWESYLYYVLLIPLPTLVFVLGLSFILMILVKNQAVTFLLLLGYIGMSLFYFKDKLFGGLDFIGFYLPLVYSDFNGFEDIGVIVLQRLSYLFIGIGFIFASIRFLDRLPQVGRWNFLNTSLFVMFVLGGVFLSFKYHHGFKEVAQARQNVMYLNNEYAGREFPEVSNYDLQVAQRGDELSLVADLRLRRAYMDTLVFSLNPEFTVDSIVQNSKVLEFDKKRQLLFVIPEKSEGRGRDVLSFYYHGVPEDYVCNLDISDNNLAASKKTMLATYRKKAGMVSRDYVLMNSDMLWYPIAGVGFNTKDFKNLPGSFSQFNLQVVPNQGLMAIAPGAQTEEEGVFTFRPETKLNRFPLVIGNYEKKSIEVDELSYRLYLKKGHDFFTESFVHIQDTLSYLITDLKESFEYDDLDLYYSFSGFNLIEVPAHFHAYERPYTLSTAYIQPEIFYFPERGGELTTANLKGLLEREKERNKERKNMKSDEQMEWDILSYSLKSTLFGESLHMRAGPGRRGNELIRMQGVSYSVNPFHVFPLYFNHLFSVSSEEYPVFNAMLEQYLKSGYEVSMFQSMTGGISNNEKANMAMKEESVVDILSRKGRVMISSTIYQSGSFVINALKNKVGSEVFDDFLYYYVEDWAFNEIDFDRFTMDFEEETGVDPRPYFSFMTEGGNLPEYLISTPEYIATRDDYGSVYLVKFKVSNLGSVTGLVDFNFRMPGGGMGGMGSGSSSGEQRFCELGPNETREVQYAFYEQPRMMTVNTLISGNIPASFAVFLRSPVKRMGVDMEEYDLVTEESVTFRNENEYIVDNEDAGFSYVSISTESKLKQYVESRKDDEDELFYKSINPGWSRPGWTPVSHSGFYGELIRSALEGRAGDGSSVATWTTELPKAGFYDVYVYIPVSAMFKRPGRRSSGGDQKGGGDSNRKGGGQRGPQFGDKGTVYNYTVESKNGKEEISYKLSDPEDGWNKLGSFHFPADSVRLVLTNETNGRRVFADAVKWVAR